jgi:hypothetical protein
MTKTARGWGDLRNDIAQRLILTTINDYHEVLLRRHPRSALVFGRSRFDDSHTISKAVGGFLSVELIVMDHGSGNILQSTFMNFDLRTGEQFDLRTVFADNIDVEAEINRWLTLNWMEDTGMRNFRGISMETQFLVDSRAQALVLKFDEKTPGLEGREAVIPFSAFGNNGNAIAIYNRFPDLPQSAWNLSEALDRRVLGMSLRQFEEWKESYGITTWIDIDQTHSAVRQKIVSRD